MKQKYILNYIKESIGNEYAMEVLYYTLKKAVLENDYNIKEVSFIDIDGKFHGEKIRVGTRMKYRSALHTFSLLLSVRALMLNEKYLSCCENDHLIFTSIPKEKYRWIENMTIILDCMEDDEFTMLYGILEDLYFDDELKDEDRERFKQSIIKPEYKNRDLFYRNIASYHQGIEDNVICNNAFVCEDFSTYEIGEDIEYIGNTAFAYCDNLETLKFNGKVSFGKFPIIECEKLRKIDVPPQLIDYYREQLPYYEQIIEDASNNSCIDDSIEPHETEKGLIKDTEIEIVYVDIPSADPYTEVEIRDNANILIDEEDKNHGQYDYTLLKHVFDKKATSYKYFWLMAIITIAKDKGILDIPYKDIVIRMAALAWPIIFNDEINLGVMDQLSKYLSKIRNTTTLKKNAQVKDVDNYLRKHFEFHKIDKILEPLLKNVPYRFLSPWIVFTSNDEVVAKTREKDYSGPYSLFDDHIILNKHWWKYIQSHHSEVYDFTLNSFIAYAKKYNDDKKFTRLKREGWRL